MTTTIELLGTQHQDVLARLAEVEAQRDAADFGAFAAYLTHEVASHFDLEERALFPALARHLGADHGPLAVMNAEHASFRELLSRLSAAVSLGERGAQRAIACELIDLLRAHIDKEDHVLFPMATRILTRAEQAEVDGFAG